MISDKERNNQIDAMGGKSKSTKKKLPIRKSESETESLTDTGEGKVDVLQTCCLPVGK